MIDSDEKIAAPSVVRIHKQNVLIGMFGVWCLAGALDAIVRAGTYYSLAIGFCEWIVPSLLVLLWVQYDAAERNFNLSSKLGATIIVFAIVAVPYYFLRTRGLKGFIAIGAAIGFLLLQVPAYLVGWYVAAELFHIPLGASVI